MKRFLLKFFSNFILNRAKRRAWRAFHCSNATARGNRVWIIKNGKKEPMRHIIPGLELLMNAHNAEVEIAYPWNMENAYIKIDTDNAKIYLGPHTKLKNVQINLGCGQNQNLFIDEGTTFEGAKIWIFENSGLRIGKDCMFSDEIHIMTGDGHAVQDITTGRYANLDFHELTIGDYVWCGRGAFITKNAQIPSYSIIGARAVVTKAFTEGHTALGGNPAKIIKRGLTWHRLTAAQMLQKEPENK